jgi:hypothetical protein
MLISFSVLATAGVTSVATPDAANARLWRRLRSVWPITLSEMVCLVMAVLHFGGGTITTEALG